MIITVVCVILEIAICALVWKTAGGEQLQEELTSSIRVHILNYNEQFESRRFLDLIQHKVFISNQTYTRFENSIDIDSKDVHVHCSRWI